MEGLSLSALAVIVMLVVLFVWHRRSPQAEPLQPDRAVLPTVATLPQLAWLDAAQYARWQQQVQRFLREKYFIGCAGYVMGPAQRGLIAGTACLLRVQAAAVQEPLFPTVREVLVYPDAFLAPPRREAVSEEGLEIVGDDTDERIGEHGPGHVVLSWADVEAAQDGEPINVVIHEFAHALDSENPATEGAPTLADYGEWSAVMGPEFARLRRHRRPPVLDPYGAQSPAEFWCVVAEAFFQQPTALARHHPALFDLFSRYLELAPPLDSP